MFTFQNQPQAIWNVMIDGFRLYRASISKVWYWQILFVLPIVLLIQIDARLYPDADSLYSIGHIAFLVAGITFVVAGFLFGSCFTFSRIYAIGVMADTTIHASMRLVFKKIWSVFAATLIFIALLLMVLVPLFLLFSMGVRVEIAFLGIYFMFLLVFVAVILVMLYPCFILFENSSPFESLKQSITHIWGNFWRTLFMLFLLYLISMFFVFVLQFIAIPDGSANILNIKNTALFVVNLLIYALITPILNATVLTIFHDVKVRKVICKS